MLMIFGRLAAAFVWIAVASPVSAAETDTTSIPIQDSPKETEILLAKILKEKLNFNSALNLRNDSSEDLVLQMRLNMDSSENPQKINTVIDTKIVARDKDGKALSQIVTIASFVDLALIPDKDSELIEWANKWNGRAVPLHIYIAGKRIVAARNLLITSSDPLTSGQFVVNFLNVVRSWPALIKDLQVAGLVE